MEEDIWTLSVYDMLHCLLRCCYVWMIYLCLIQVFYQNEFVTVLQAYLENNALCDECLVYLVLRSIGFWIIYECFPVITKHCPTFNLSINLVVQILFSAIYQYVVDILCLLCTTSAKSKTYTAHRIGFLVKCMHFSRVNSYLLDAINLFIMNK